MISVLMLFKIARFILNKINWFVKFVLREWEFIISSKIIVVFVCKKFNFVSIIVKVFKRIVSCVWMVIEFIIMVNKICVKKLLRIVFNIRLVIL